MGLTSFSKRLGVHPFHYTYFSVVGHMSFQCLAILNKAAIIVLLCVFLVDLFSFSLGRCIEEEGLGQLAATDRSSEAAETVCRA